MSRGATGLAIGLAFLSGIPALVYQVVWTRQVALIAGGQIEAISIVLVAFFGGLALGTHYFGTLSDRTTSPLRLYGLLEIGAGLLAASSVWTLRELGDNPQLSSTILLGASAALLIPTTFLLGGTLPALLRWFATTPESTPARAGILLGANTVGAVLGVGVAITSIPAVGLRASLLGATAGALAIGVGALAFARPSSLTAERTTRPSHIEATVLGAAFLVGTATLGFEVLAARLATLRLGSSLYAWGLVLALFLLGLAAGNLALSRRARTTSNAALDLGWLEVAAACAVVSGLALLRPELASPTAHLALENLSLVALAVLPATFCMGGAFPLLVRLAVRDQRIGAAFGRLSAFNTLGGLIGALLVPFVLIPELGSIATSLIFATANAGVGLAFLFARGSTRRRRRLAVAIACLAISTTAALRPTAPIENPWVLFIAEGRQATAVVTDSWGIRTLMVDGDPEASTAGDARRTEELLAILPLLLHPMPEHFLEIGLGSGITLGTATRFPLERIDCVEIAEAVIQAAVYFEPDNRQVVSGDSVQIIHADARRALALTPATYDVISANTLHPWSVGATGLYSSEYFSRIARALRPGGVAVQWLPVEQISGESFTLILRTFFDVFPEGGLWWGAGNVIAVGALDPILGSPPREMDTRLAAADLSWRRLGWAAAEDLLMHRIADANSIRSALGHGDLLLDDRPLLELHAARGRIQGTSGALYEILVSMAKRDVGRGAMLFWLESLALRASGDQDGADVRERLAADLGLRIAIEARLLRQIASAHSEILAGRLDDAGAVFETILVADPNHRDALFGRAGLAIQDEKRDAAIRDFRRILSDSPDDVRAWNELAGVFSRHRDLPAATRAIKAALSANPFDIRTLANAGLIAIDAGDLDRAASFLARIRALSPLGHSAQEVFLRDALGKAENRI